MISLLFSLIRLEQDFEFSKNLSYYCYIRNKVTKHLKNNRKGADLEDKGGFANLKTAANERVQVFTFKQLHSATGGFSKSNVVGKGGFGLVCGRVLHDGRKVAIKFIGEKKSLKWRWSCLVGCILSICSHPLL
ncbi:hypothetical protein M0R45_031231 [Rubus argutus]|uniref:Uncharacterized protein n=1 Tax=Rubus argutus TaxID=59490 RepID=A0AAW1WGV2_RUBAR